MSWPDNDTADKGHERLSGCPEVKDPAKAPGKDKFKEASPLEPTSATAVPIAPWPPSTETPSRDEISAQLPQPGHTALTEALFAECDELGFGDFQ